MATPISASNASLKEQGKEEPVKDSQAPGASTRQTQDGTSAHGFAPQITAIGLASANSVPQEGFSEQTMSMQANVVVLG